MSGYCFEKDVGSEIAWVVFRYTGRGRAGLSGAQASSWVSDTSVMCKLSAGVDGSLVLAMTSGLRVGSVSNLVSYDASAVSTSAWVNEGTTSGASMTVSGADFGTSGWVEDCVFVMCGLGILPYHRNFLARMPR